MRTLIYLFIGILFGITMFKSEAASWFRIYEMFKFESFHMYGIIGTALAVGLVVVQLIKRYKINSFYGEPIIFMSKERSIARYLIGGIIFGLGWALAGACPGPMFTLAGAGYAPILVVIVASLLGTFLYGLLKDQLPH
ncbi:YeeE/YedE thiosulfate transporter family protein [Flavobacteriaceae bacterium]|nr:YeeE/YedE thiosulfate transporter family protein [Flavobacteriaceae bacterium]